MGWPLCQVLSRYQGGSCLSAKAVGSPRAARTLSSSCVCLPSAVPSVGRPPERAADPASAVLPPASPADGLLSCCAGQHSGLGLPGCPGCPVGSAQSSPQSGRAAGSVPAWHFYWHDTCPCPFSLECPPQHLGSQVIGFAVFHSESQTHSEGVGGPGVYHHSSDILEVYWSQPGFPLSSSVVSLCTGPVISL